MSINENDIVERGPLVPKRLDAIYFQDDKGHEEEVEEIDHFNQFDEPLGDVCAPEMQTSPDTPNSAVEAHPLCPLNAILTPNLETAPDSGLSSNAISDDLNHKQASCDLTQKIPRHHKERRRKKLFSGPSSEDNNPDEQNQSGLGFTVSDELLANCDENKNDASFLKSRLKEHHVIFSNIPEHTPERPRGNHNLKILAYDTPEEDYGLTVRQRILKKYKKQKKNT